jgi:glycosyltransferase involved in cell wall biosynthesis
MNEMVAVISTFEEASPPWLRPNPLTGGTYGGTEAIVGEEVKGYDELGIPARHYASQGSYAPRHGELIVCADEPIRHTLTEKTTLKERHDLNMKALKGAVMDIKTNRDHIGMVINHFGPLALKLLREEGVDDIPIATKYHGQVTDEDRRIHADYGGINVFISHSQRENAGMPGYVVYNGIDPARFPLRTQPVTPDPEAMARAGIQALPPPGYILAYGSYALVKGFPAAIQAAWALGRQLVLAGKTDPSNAEFRRRFIDPYVDNKDVFAVGEVGLEGQQILHAAAGTGIFPIQWEEPFGLSMIEASAMGLPIGVLGNGALRETVEHGVSGIVARNLWELINMWPILDTLKPEDCRAHVLGRFTIQHMVEGMTAIIGSVMPRLLGPTIIDVGETPRLEAHAERRIHVPTRRLGGPRRRRPDIGAGPFTGMYRAGQPVTTSADKPLNVF